MGWQRDLSDLPDLPDLPHSPDQPNLSWRPDLPYQPDLSFLCRALSSSLPFWRYSPRRRFVGAQQPQNFDNVEIKVQPAQGNVYMLVGVSGNSGGKRWQRRR